MAKLLALDTSTRACSVALDLDGNTDEIFVVAPQDHTQRLLPMVDELLNRHHVALADLDAIAFGAGPGSFTGLRICLGVVQGLAFGADLPTIPLSSLAIAAASARRLLALSDDALVIPAFDARMDEIYWGMYAIDGCARDDCVSTPSDLRDAIASLQGKSVIGVGDGWRCAGMPTAALRDVAVDLYPHALDAAMLARAVLQRDETVSPLDTNPIYIRNEVRWTKRQKIRS